MSNDRTPSVLLACLAMVLSLVASSAVLAAGYPFTDDFESGLTEWAADPPWGGTTAFYSSPAHSVTDSPSTFYAAGVDASLGLATSLDLTPAVNPVLRFRHRHQLEDGHDFGHVEISTDGGSSWSSPLASYTGGQATWAREQVDLSAAAGYNDVRIRFRIAADGTVQQDGWYIDDVLIAEAPAAVTLATPSTITPNSVDLSWTASAEPGFLAYRIYRSTTPAFDWRTANLVAEITAIGTTSHTDITVSPKTTYHYKVMVVTSDELHSLSNEESATTPAGMDVPFLDDGEGGGSSWTADPPWALSTETAFSGSSAWSDSPGGDYGNSIPSQSLTLVGPIDLTSSTAPVLSFVHTWEFLSGDSGHVEVSTDGGGSWTDLAAFTNGSSDGWLRERFELDPYAFSNDVFIRFRITTDSSAGADGWHVDDISVAESPTVVDPPILSDVTSHSIRLTWSRCNDVLFSHYAIFRSTTSGVGIQSTLVAEIHDQDTLTFNDTGLAIDTDYFYRVYAVSPYGTFSPDSASESSARTGGNPFPFSDDFEGSLDAWNLTGDWATTDTDQHGGSWSLTDTPGTTYPTHANSSAWTAIDLRGSIRPVLSFWDRFALADTGDWARVELSTNGTTWTRVYSATLTGSGWARQQIDLSPWKNEANLRIRFLFTSNSSGVGDGWYIDDLVIDDDSSSPATPGFSDGFELGDGNWLGSAWALTGASPHSGSACIQSTPQGRLLDGTSHSLVLAGDLDLSTAVDPQLVYWIRGLAAYRGYFNVESSIDGGQTWIGLPGASVGHSVAIPDWTRYQISLAGLLVDDVRIRFRSWQQSGFTNDTNIYLDDIAIEEMPQPVTLTAPVPHLKSVDLSWSESTLGDFDRYEVYRSTAANVTTANDLVFSSATITDTSFTDTGLSIGATYYYKVFTFNSNNVATPSNERSTTTVPLGFPFADPMENLDNWDTNGAWGPDGFSPYAGSFSINDSPGGNSPTSSNTSILTAINLTGSTWPVLRFWDRFGLADDWGWVDVSTNGSTWTRVYSATGARTTWAQQAIDLSPWKSEPNLRIRFTVATGSSNVDEGWYLDELSITNHGGTIPLPFFDDLELGTGSWLASAWSLTGASPHSGTVAMESTPQGTLLDGTTHVLALAGELDLAAAVDPQLVYWIRGDAAYRGYFNVESSVDGGRTWVGLPGASIGHSVSVPDWTRYQISLSGLLQNGVRIRFTARQQSGFTRSTNLYIDDISVEEMPDPVVLASPVPHLKSVDLSWTESTLGDFDRYEVYRSTTAGVTTANDLVFSSATSTDTGFTDTGLSIGATYYYKVFTFNTRGVATPSNERSTTTVPLPFPFADPMENLDSWDTNGAWGPDGFSPYSGSFSINDSPGGNSPTSTSTSILTAINLSGSTWPVLRFWDRHGLADDWGYVDVSPDGTSWTRLYSAIGTRASWARQEIDLSPWKTESNLRIRFTVGTNHADVDEGWYIDELSVTDNSGTVTLPFYDDFESGTGNWLPAAWAPSGDAPHGGSWSMQSTPQGTILHSTSHSMELAGDLDLATAVDPQLTYWLRGDVYYRGYYRTQVSTDGGETWADLAGTSLFDGFHQDWTRYQVSLAPYVGGTVRLRFHQNQGSSYSSTTSVFVDDVAIEELPQPVTLNSPDQLTVSAMRLTWNDLNDPDFAAYAIYRSDTATVDTSSTLVTTITDQATTEFTDTGLQTRKTYYYRLYFIDTSTTHSPSNSVSATTLGATLPFADDFESDSGVWTVTGDWGPVVAAGVGGTTSLGDSPGDLTPNLDGYAVTGVDLSGTTWPILSFSERFDFAGHWGYVQVSADEGTSWTPVAGVTSDQLGWVHRRFDLSPWRGQPIVWIQFFLDANSTTSADGWHIDDLFIGENPLAGSPVTEFFDGLEAGNAEWLNGQWSLTTDDPYAGSTAILDTPANRAGGTELWLTYGHELDLSSATDPLLTVEIRGNLPYRNHFRTEVSTDGGLTWQNLPDFDLNYYWTSASWIRLQTSLSGYLVPDLRLRFRTYGNNGGDENIFLDNISVGEQTPGAPTLNSPAWGASEPTVRPTLVVDNAVDYQSDPMTYEYQVFDDASLTSVVAQVPAVAGGTETTAWTVDIDLQPDTQYWWRCRATDDSNHTGDWMDTATFFVQLSNHPPTVPELLAPANGETLPDLTGRLSWLESTDPDADAGDWVDGYRVQVDDDPAFASPEIDQSDIVTTEAAGALSVMLSELAGSGSLVTETRYSWRVAARDNNGLWSGWSAGPAHFVFGDDLTPPTCTITSPAGGATVTDTPITVTGTATDALSGTDVVELSTDGGTTWVHAVGDTGWSHEWWPPLSGDYQLSCRATDVAGNQSAPSTPITVTADLDRTMVFATDIVSVGEDAGSFDVQVALSGARAVEVNADLLVSGTAQSGVDFTQLPDQVRFFPGQTELSFPVAILDDGDFEGDETLIIELANPNLPDITFGAVSTLTVTILDDDPDPVTVIFLDGFETGDVSAWTSSAP